MLYLPSPTLGKMLHRRGQQDKEFDFPVLALLQFLVRLLVREFFESTHSSRLKVLITPFPNSNFDRLQISLHLLLFL